MVQNMNHVNDFSIAFIIFCSWFILHLLSIVFGFINDFGRISWQLYNLWYGLSSQKRNAFLEYKPPQSFHPMLLTGEEKQTLILNLCKRLWSVKCAFPRQLLLEEILFIVRLVKVRPFVSPIVGYYTLLRMDAQNIWRSFSLIKSEPGESRLKRKKDLELRLQSAPMRLPDPGFSCWKSRGSKVR